MEANTVMPPLTIHLPGRPVPCPRPRVGSKGAYYPPRYESWREAMGLYVNSAMAQYEPLEGAVTASVLVNVDGRCGDVDNYTKSALDVVQAQVFAGGDDKAVQDLFVSRRQQAPLGMICVFETSSEAAVYRQARLIIERAGSIEAFVAWAALSE